MILLCDLDGTLLSNSMGNFNRPISKHWGTHLDEIVPRTR